MIIASACAQVRDGVVGSMVRVEHPRPLKLAYPYHLALDIEVAGRWSVLAKMLLVKFAVLIYRSRLGPQNLRVSARNVFHHDVRRAASASADPTVWRDREALWCYDRRSMEY
jgi:hypothetical protein